MKNKWKERIISRSGAAWPVVFLAVLTAAAFLLIVVWPGYRRHLTDARRTFDAQSVATAKDVASITYLQEGESGLKVYYYDEIGHQALDRKDIASIKPYGRTDREGNRRRETGARGVPNLGDRGGAQLLAVAVREGEPVNARWTGKHWTYPDYVYMTRAERALLTASERRQMDLSSQRLGRSRAREQYEEDYREDLEEGADPGTAVYVYDALEDEVYYDQKAQEALEGAAPLPRGAQTFDALAMPAYDVGQFLGKVVVITVSAPQGRVQTETAWTRGSSDGE